MAVITKQELEDASADAATLEAVANGTGTVTSRLGASIKTVRQVISELAAQDIGTSAAASINTRINPIERNTALISSLFSIAAFINTSGVQTGDPNYKCTDFIETALIDVTSISLVGHPNVASIAFYTSKKAFISGSIAGTNGGLVTAYPSVPSNAKYVRFTYLVASLSTQSISIVAKLGNYPSADTNATLDALNKNTLGIQKLFSRVGYVNTSGTLTVDSGWGTTPFIDVSYIDVVDLLLYGHTAAYSIAFYDTAYAFISGVKGATIGEDITTYPAVPSNAKYVTFTYNVGVLSSQKFRYATRLSSLPPSSLAAGKVIVNLATYATNPGYITTTGTSPNTDVNWAYSDFIKCKAGDQFVCNLWGHTVVNCVSFYDSSKGYLSGYAATGTTAPNAIFAQTVTAPSNAAYIRISFGVPSASAVPDTFVNACVFEGKLTDLFVTQSPSTNSQAAFSLAPFQVSRDLGLSSTDKVLLYGDSISSTDYTFYKTAMEDLTGAVIYNGGFSGYTTAQLASNAQFQRILDYGARLVLALVGGNDSGAVGTVGTFSGAVIGEPIVTETNIANDYNGTYFIQAISHIMRKFKASYENIRTRANLTGSETEAEKTAKIDAVLKPILVFLTTLPQKRTDANNAFSIEDNWLRKRNAVIECSQKYGIICIDTYKKCNFDMSLEPYYVGPTNMTNNQGVWFMDGVHPNKYGYRRLAEVICGELSI